MIFMPKPGVLGACILAVLVSTHVTAAQGLRGAASATPAAPAQPEPATDALGRTTPRGTVVGFLSAARKGELNVARQFLNTDLHEKQAEALARQLFVVLDARLPARLTLLSDAPEGSRANPLALDQDIVGHVEGRDGDVAIVVQRVTLATGPVWLFSTQTLESVPALYDDVVAHGAHPILPRLLTDTRIAGIRLFDWMALLLGLPAFYLATVLLNRVLIVLTRLVRRRTEQDGATPNALPFPVRVLIVMALTRWLLGNLPVSLLVRQILSNLASLLTIAMIVWLLITLTGVVEGLIARRIPPGNFGAASSLLRVGRRVVDVLVLFVGLIAVLRHLGINPTPMLAGLGVGGIAVALAAQKTLENIIAGASLIFDQAVRVGDFLKIGDLQGTVDHIGLRSTRIRTLDRTVVSVPNGQIANMSLETLSARDKFWFHHVVGLRYETTADQLHAVLDAIRNMLVRHPAVDEQSVRVRFLNLGHFSLDVDLFAYVFARDWNHFLEIQEQLLFTVTAIVSDAGTSIAFPSQTMYVASPAGSPAEDLLLPSASKRPV